MECTTTTFEIYGQYNVRLGVLDAKGNVWSGDIAMFKIVDDRIYSMHKQSPW